MILLRSLHRHYSTVYRCAIAYALVIEKSKILLDYNQTWDLLMKEVLRRFNISGKHMLILDEFLRSNDAEYQRMESKLTGLGEDYLEFCRELYFGGCKSKGNPPLGSRQMILSDIFQYILTSRGYYQATEGEEQKKKFVKIVMYLVNQWLIMDCFGPKQALNLRRNLMNTLSQQIGTDFFEGQDSYHIEGFQETLNYSEDLIPKPPNPHPPSSQILTTYDSLFPKIRGGPIEILVYLYLIQRNLGFVVSLLTQQRLVSGKRIITPPDILLLRRKGEVMGLEIGRGKERQSADFSLLTGIPTFSVDLVERQPFRCDGCGRWIIYCERVIELYAEQGIPQNHILYCVECPYFNSGNCPDIICYLEATNRYGETRVARYHLRCIDPDTRARLLENINEYRQSLVAYFPLVEGLENFPEE